MISILDINEVTRFLINHPDWNTDQLFFCLIHEYDEQYCRTQGYNTIHRPISLLYKYFHKKGSKAFKKEDIDYLLDEGYIAKIGPKVKIDMVRVTSKFKNEFFGLIDFDDLYMLYPSFMTNFNHPSQPDIKLKAGNKEQLEKSYLSKIKTDIAHKRVLEITAWAKENDELNMSIEKYIGSEMWDQIEVKMSSVDLEQAEL